MKVLIFGKYGQLATCLKENRINGFTYTFLSRKECDLGNVSEIAKNILEINPNVIVNCSAYTNVEASQDPSNYRLAEKINVLALASIGQVSATLNIPVIHISTDYVFDGIKSELYKEDDIASPINNYGMSKLLGEKALIESNEKHIILRASWLFSEYGNNFLTNIVRKIKGNDKILNIVDDQLGAPTYCVDLANVINELLINYEKTSGLDYGIYHYSGYPYASWYDFANEILQVIRITNAVDTNIIPIKTKSLSLQAKRPMNSRLCVSKIYGTYGINPSDWKFAINKIVNKVWNNESN
jgi:dTDP-4-dehydrorhamnose reductase